MQFNKLIIKIIAISIIGIKCIKNQFNSNLNKLMMIGVKKELVEAVLSARYFDFILF